jgi:hypothetical protein
MTTMKRWPLYLIASPAVVAIWAGWVQLGELCGFGLVTPLPGILPGFHLNTAITLPVGIEAYGAYALGAALSPGTPLRARGFAWRSALGALGLGMLGQVISHLLAAAHAAAAPWPVVVLVSCLPVATLGFAAALTHLLHEAVPEDVSEDVPAVSAVHLNGSGLHPAEAEPFAADLAAGKVPGIRRIRDELHIGQPKAQEIQSRLKVLAGSNGHGGLADS